MLFCTQHCWRSTCPFMFSYLDTRSLAGRQVWLSSDTGCCTSSEGLRAPDFSGSKIHFHRALKNWHQICKWLLCELLIEALSMQVTNQCLSSGDSHVSPLCLGTRPFSTTPALAHPCGSSCSGMAEAAA